MYLLTDMTSQLWSKDSVVATTSATTLFAASFSSPLAATLIINKIITPASDLFA